jgi:hypothetical protein
MIPHDNELCGLYIGDIALTWGSLRRQAFAACGHRITAPLFGERGYAWQHYLDGGKQWYLENTESGFVTTVIIP